MSFYEIIEETTTCWYDDDEHVEHNVWADDIAMYLRAEEAWPTGASIRHADHCAERVGTGFHEEEPTDFDD